MSADIERKFVKTRSGRVYNADLAPMRCWPQN